MQARRVPWQRLLVFPLIAVLTVALPGILAKLLFLRLITTPEGYWLAISGGGWGGAYLLALAVTWWCAAVVLGTSLGAWVASRFLDRNRLYVEISQFAGFRFSPYLLYVLAAIYGCDEPGKTEAERSPEVYRMVRRLVILVALLGGTVLGMSALLTSQLGRNQMWQQEVASLARQEGYRKASLDFRADRLRLYELAGENEKLRPQGRREGPFEVWAPPYAPSLGAAYCYERQQFVLAYNERMRDMKRHPERLRKTDATPQPLP